MGIGMSALIKGGISAWVRGYHEMFWWVPLGIQVVVIHLTYVDYWQILVKLSTQQEYGANTCTVFPHQPSPIFENEIH